MTLVRPKSLRELALEHIREQIIHGTFKMGQPLSERKISEELGVSKSPVREALAQLREEGLVLIEPQKGAQVFTLTIEEVNQICDFRQVIETAAFKLALERNAALLAKDMALIVRDMTKAQEKKDSRKYLSLDSDFHMLIFRHCNNSYLQASYERYSGKIAALRTHLSGLPQHTSLSFDEHHQMADAALQNDFTKIENLLKTHIDRTRKTYVDSLALLPKFEQ